MAKHIYIKVHQKDRYVYQGSQEYVNCRPDHQTFFGPLISSNYNILSLMNDFICNILWAALKSVSSGCFSTHKKTTVEGPSPLQAVTSSVSEIDAKSPGLNQRRLESDIALVEIKGQRSMDSSIKCSKLIQMPFCITLNTPHSSLHTQHSRLHTTYSTLHTQHSLN